MKKSALIVLALIASGAAHGDATFHFNDGSFAKISSGRVAVGDSQGVALFEPGREAFLMVDHEDQTVMEVTPSFASDMSSMMSAQMEQMMAGMSAEERAIVEQSMPGMLSGGGMQPEPMTATSQRTGETDSVAGYDCDVFELTQQITTPFGVETTSEVVCVATVSELGISRSDFDAIANAMNAMVRMVGFDDASQVSMDFSKLGGIPIRTVDKRYGVTSELDSLSTDAIDDAEFAVPSGYQRITMEDMMRQ